MIEFLHCRAIYDELSSTGGIGLVADPSLRRVANEDYRIPCFRDVRGEGINSPCRVAARKALSGNFR